jgi:hypothetical protein
MFLRIVQLQQWIFIEREPLLKIAKAESHKGFLACRFIE